MQHRDDDLVRACLKGDEDAWSVIIDTYKNLVLSIPLKYGFPLEEADEIFQDVCLTLVLELPKLRNPQALAAWLIQTTSHKCLRLKREQQRYVAEPDKALSSVSSGDLADRVVSEAEREQVVRDAIADLPPRCRELVRMLFFQEPSIPYAAIADRLTVAKSSIGFIRMRCLDRLRHFLEKRGFE